LTLATVPEIWGHRRDLWTAQGGAAIGGQTVFPMSRNHRGATVGSTGVCGLHFTFDGAAFEMLFAGTEVRVTLVVDGQYMAPQVIRTALNRGVVGAPLSAPNSLVRFDFGSAALRQVSVYARSSQGPCLVNVAAGDHLRPWDRSGEASLGVMADSYGGAFGPNWGVGGPFWEAAALLGIPHIDIDAAGGTGYAPNNANADTRNPGNAFGARLPSCVNSQPDLFVTAGGINDNNSIPAPPLYSSAAEALAGFNASVSAYYLQLRAALPDSVLAATGPWAPREIRPTDPVAQSKADTIKAALQRVGGPWVFLDNLNGGWVNSAGATAPPSGPWQTGTGNSSAPSGNGNGDLYLEGDGVHPNPEGCLYLGTRLATDLRAALLAL
jgi:lysophospholipase L1-like esterase